MIYDATYTEREFACKAGWGHSTWVEGIKLCQTAGARRLALFHHEPDHDDADMEAIEAEARSVWSPVFAAREGNRHAGVRHHPGGNGSHLPLTVWTSRVGQSMRGTILIT